MPILARLTGKGVLPGAATIHVPSRDPDRPWVVVVGEIRRHSVQLEDDENLRLGGRRWVIPARGSTWTPSPPARQALDLALGIGGVPRGRIVEIFGPESSGKTTLVYHVIVEAQKLGGVCAFVDAEHAMDPLYAQHIGVNIDELLVSQPDYGEQAQARMMSQAMRKLAGNLNRAQTLCLFTNQIREKVGVMFRSPETQPGGRALKFYASQRLDIRRIETLKDGTEAVGNRVRVKVVKNKVAAPFKREAAPPRDVPAAVGVRVRPGRRVAGSSGRVPAADPYRAGEDSRAVVTAGWDRLLCGRVDSYRDSPVPRAVRRRRMGCSRHRWCWAYWSSFADRRMSGRADSARC